MNAIHQIGEVGQLMQSVAANPKIDWSRYFGAEIDFPTLLAAGVPYLVDTAPAISPAPFVRRYSNGRAFQLAIVKILIEQIEHLRYLQNDYICKDIFYFCESQLTHHRLKSKL